MKTENGREVMGTWHVDGFCTDQIITPKYEKGWHNCTQWTVVKRCSFQEEAQKECDMHNKQAK
jgi:hypothetical protein